MLKQLAERVLARDAQIDIEDEPTFALNTRVKPVVRIINGSLDEDPSSPNAIVLNGRIDPDTLRFLKVDNSYQRPLGERADIFTALKEGIVVPNIEVGVRGQDFHCEGDDYVITGPAYIIDGWQRVGNALRILEMVPNHPIRMFATVHFGTDEIWERHRFTALNKNVKKVSPNLHLRNMRDGNEAILTLYGLSNNTREFALYKKVSWSQAMKRDELITALLLAGASVSLHAHKGGARTATAEGIAQHALKAAQAVRLDQFRRNVAAFFDVIEECWGIRAIEYRSAAPQIRGTFMNTLARVFSDHLDFWDQTDRGFFVSADLRRKLAKFPLNDPHVKNLASSGGTARHILYDMIVSHINSGKRTGHLRPRAAK